MGRFVLLQWQYVWSSPLGVFGLLVEVLFHALGWVAQKEGRRLTITGPLAERMMRRGWSGMTVGWSQFYWFTPVQRTVFHEERHVQQVLRWGVLLPLLYLGALLVKGYRDNWFEVDARNYAGLRMQEEFARKIGHVKDEAANRS